ncbi:MAG TPA: hypothetical protein ENH55_15250 [Aurantimonas coralicida]|uniref:Uncharacterized protein n=2 Tax=root TaxID=1 RepID=A0A9C9TJ99_9HYPH|nr:hypothetical protein [Aurantimonas coralicida]HEU02628.1 hypothetical protein [Aurantimonas coralicida]
MGYKPTTTIDRDLFVSQAQRMELACLADNGMTATAVNAAIDMTAKRCLEAVDLDPVLTPEAKARFKQILGVPHHE